MAGRAALLCTIAALSVAFSSIDLVLDCIFEFYQSCYRQASDREFLISDVLCVICEIKKSMHRLPAVNPTRAAAATLHMEA